MAHKEPVLIINTRPNEANPDGDIFGGWLMSQLDVAGAITATKRAKNKVATVAVKDMHFVSPVFVHDVVSIYAEVETVGNTSVTIKLDAYSDRDYGLENQRTHVAEARFIYVSIAKPGVKKLIPKE